MGTTVYSSDLRPNPQSPRDVLAFVLCPATAFAESHDPDELAAVEEIIGSVKEEAIRRWFELITAANSN